VPDIKTFEGLLDVLSLCNLMELANIINPKMYGGNSMNRERHAMIYGRQIARNLIETIFSVYELVDENNKAVSPKSRLILPYLAQQAKCLLTYKAEAVEQEAHSDNIFCTYEAVLDEVRRYCVNNTAFLEIFNNCCMFDSFAWAGPAWLIRRKAKRSVPRRKHTVIQSRMTTPIFHR
jgi:hypothetical protein